MRNTNSKNHQKVQIIITSGFLGAGKTTFIQKLASSLPEGRAVILENEFGDVDLDGAVLGERGFSVVSVRGGCICCTGVGDFAGAIQEAVERFAPERILIEPTGVAKLSEVIAQFGLPPLLGLCGVEQAVTVVDAKNFERRMLVSEEFFENQMRSANVILLSKTEGLTEAELAEVALEIKHIAPQGLLIAQPWESLDSAQQEACLQYRKAHAPQHHDHAHHDHEHDHHGHADHVFATYTFPCESTVELIGKQIGALASGEAGTVLRVKGVARTADGGLATVDYVPGDFRTEVWQGAPIDPFLTFIGAGLDEEKLRNLAE